MSTLIAPFAGHKSMANFGVEDGALTDACFPVFSARELIQALYFECLTEREYAKQIGISQKGVNKRRQKVLDKLRSMMKAK